MVTDQQPTSDNPFGRVSQDTLDQLEENIAPIADRSAASLPDHIFEIIVGRTRDNYMRGCGVRSMPERTIGELWEERKAFEQMLRMTPDEIITKMMTYVQGEAAAGRLPCKRK